MGVLWLSIVAELLLGSLLWDEWLLSIATSALHLPLEAWCRLIWSTVLLLRIERVCLDGHQANIGLLLRATNILRHFHEGSRACRIRMGLVLLLLILH